MTQIDPQLVKRIAEQVIAALAAPGNHSTLPAAAAVRPPIGVCTGDYAEFTDRPDLVGGGAAATTALAKPQAAVLSGFVTARHLEDAKTTDIVLAPGARLTPLAQDYAREHKLTVTASKGKPAPAPAKQKNVFLTWADGPCPAVASTTKRLADRLAPVRVGDNALHVAIGDLARAVAAKRATGGVLFVRSAARAACYANRCPSLRAVVGTCGEAVEQGIAELGANVLIVEYPHHGAQAIDAMVDRFTAAAPALPPDVGVNLKELATCA